ncbi:hypothetical protein FDF45_14095 [Clostridium botulinum]|nr:hypothetical protein [Clostridium botulinum]
MFLTILFCLAVAIIFSTFDTNLLNLYKFSFGVSILDYIILMKIYLNDSAFEYVLIYSVLWIVGYTIIYIVKK